MPPALLLPSPFAVLPTLGRRQLVDRDDQQRLDPRPGIFFANYDRAAFSDGDEFRMTNGERSTVGQSNCKRLEWLLAQGFTKSVEVHKCFATTVQLMI
jgi:hypothetical protein